MSARAVKPSYTVWVQYAYQEPKDVHVSEGWPSWLALSWLQGFLRPTPYSPWATPIIGFGIRGSHDG